MNTSLNDTLVNLRTLVGQARMLGASDDEILTRVVFALLRTRPHAEVVARLVKLLDVLHEGETPAPRAVPPLEFDGIGVAQFPPPDDVIVLPDNPRTASPELRHLLRNAILRNRISSFAPALGGRAPELADALVDDLLPIIASVDANAHARGRAEASG